MLLPSAVGVSLRAQGANLDSIDIIGMTPLMKAILRSRSLKMAKVLLRLGANVNVYMSVLEGTALHHCVDREHEKTVNLLLSYGADPCIKNDDGNTALELARQNGLFNIVRAIEGRISLFQGWMREKYGPCSFMKRMIWAVVLPCELRISSRPRKLVLAIYLVSENKPASNPRAVIELWQSQIERKLNEEDPCITIFDKETEYRYEILSVDEGDKRKLQQFYDACHGIAQVANMDPADSLILDSLPTSSSLAPSEPFASSMDDIELAMAIKASIQSAIAEGVPNVQSTVSSDNMNDRENFASNSLNGRWHPADAPEPPSLVSSQAQVDTPSSSTYNQRDIPGIGSNRSSSSTYNRSSSGSGNTPSRTCVICLDAPVEGACVPCGHMAFCMSCLRDIKSKDGACPICRATINQVLRLYQV
ncbi:unnamed protein product [Urochloa decumbens]|uniref:RING-type domain-containing protein n=1 Tax=Urochloa decumbens TaxID=240449 RepID=A0ABC9GBP0_9POAL